MNLGTCGFVTFFYLLFCILTFSKVNIKMEYRFVPLPVFSSFITM